MYVCICLYVTYVNNSPFAATIIGTAFGGAFGGGVCGVIIILVPFLAVYVCYKYWNSERGKCM